MFTSRFFNFSIQNQSQVNIHYDFEFFDEFTGSSDPGYF